MLHSGPEVLLGDNSLSELGLVGLLLGSRDDDSIVTLGDRGGVVGVGVRGSDLLGESGELLGEDGEDVSEGEFRVHGVSEEGKQKEKGPSASSETEYETHRGKIARLTQPSCDPSAARPKRSC